MTPDDIRDVLARYATGSLTAEEHKRLFDAALDDQELFDELAREDDVRQLLAAPGVRDRLIHSLQPPKRRLTWVLALAPVAVLSALMIVVLMRPAPKPKEVAVVTAPASSPAAPEPVAAPPQDTAPQPSGVPERAKTKETDQLRRDEKPAVSKDQPVEAKQLADADENALKKDVEKRAADQKEAPAKAKAMDQVAAAPPPASPTTQAKAEGTVGGQVQVQASQVQLSPAAQQNAPGGPRQNAVQEAAQALAPKARGAGKSGFIGPRFGIHYSIQTAGHLILIPAADGYLSVKSGDGAVLFAPQPVAAGSLTDISLPSGVQSLSILFSAAQLAPRVSPTARRALEDTVEAPAGGPLAVAIELKVKP